MKNAKKILSAMLTVVLLLTQVLFSFDTTALAYEMSASELKSQIASTYAAAKQRYGGKSFNGYCGAYVRYQLESLGITASGELSGNGNQWWPMLCRIDRTSMGYSVRRFAGKSCINDIVSTLGNANNIVVGFKYGTGSEGLQYGHVLFIHGILEGNVYYSESSAFGNVPEGNAQVRSVSSFYSAYSACTFDGAAVLTPEPEKTESTASGILGAVGSIVQAAQDALKAAQNNITISGQTVPSGTLPHGKAFALKGVLTANGDIRIASVAAGIYRSDWSVTGEYAEARPNAKTYDLSTYIDSKLIFNHLEGGQTYHYLVTAKDTNGTKYDLINAEFSVAGGAASALVDAAMQAVQDALKAAQNNITISGQTVPSGTLPQGKAFALKGVLTANGDIKIASVAAGIYRSDWSVTGEYAEARPNAKTYDLSTYIDYQLIFNHLEGGQTYHYLVTAKDTNGTVYELINAEFSVEGSAAAALVDAATQAAADAINAAMNAQNSSTTGETRPASSNEEIIFNFCVDNMKLNAAAACGILANIEKESGFVPDKLEYGYTWETGGYGICQWTNTPRGSETGRRTNLVNFCTANGYDYKSLTGQLYFMKHELETNVKPGVLDYLKGVSNTAQGAYDAGWKWCYTFEVPANYPEVSVTRGNCARDKYWPKYMNTTVFLPGKSQLSADKSQITAGGSITFTASSDTATDYHIGVDKDGQRIITQAMPNGRLTLSFNDAGSYSAYVTASNSAGGCDSARITFTVEQPKVKVTFHRNQNAADEAYVTETFVYGTANQRFGHNTDGTGRYQEMKDAGTGFGKWFYEGYSLLGWSTDPDASEATYSTYSGVADTWIKGHTPAVDLYAVWEIHTAAIRYNVNGGEIESGSEFYAAENGDICKTETQNALEHIWKYNATHQNGLYNASTFEVSRANYRFVGWSTSRDGGTVFDQNDVTVTGTDLFPDIIAENGAVTLYAQWEPDVLCGDANGDGSVDLKDVTTMRRALAGGWTLAFHEDAADVNCDGSFDMKDTVTLRRYLAGGWDITLE